MTKNLTMSMLMDFYGQLLTDKQRDTVDLYYHEDLSLSEIAEEIGISSQGVSDSIKRGERLLNEYEEMCIRDSYDTINGLDDIANNFYMSKCYLCRKFKNDTGMTLTQYINHVRIQKSCELLAATDMTIAQISISCGYDSQAYYSLSLIHILYPSLGP